MTDAQLWKTGFDLASIVTALLIIGASILLMVERASRRSSHQIRRK